MSCVALTHSVPLEVWSSTKATFGKKTGAVPEILIVWGSEGGRERGGGLGDESGRRERRGRGNGGEGKERERGGK